MGEIFEAVVGGAEFTCCISLHPTTACILQCITRVFVIQLAVQVKQIFYHV